MDEKKAIIDRLHRLCGQLRALERLVEEGADCEQVLTQFAAARSAFQKVGVRVVAAAMRECVMPKGASEAEKESIERALGLFQQYSKYLQ